MGNENQELGAAYLKNEAAAYFKKDATFILGVSGGPDSMALMYLFHKSGLSVLAVHVNYQKRGKESDLDQELSEQMAFAWGFECISIRLDPEEASGKNFQNWARDQRYQIFRALKQEYRADAIVTAHHQDDQVETILQKILRGSSPAAWQGMKTWDGEIFRPLLPFYKNDILNYCEEAAVPFRMDESNMEAGFARNFIRHELSGKLDFFFPGWRQNIIGLQKYAELFEKSIQFITDSVYTNNRIRIDDYKELPYEVRPAVLKEIMDQSIMPKTYSKGQLMQLSKLDQLQVGKSIEIQPFLFTRNREEIIIQLQKNEDTGDVETSISKQEAMNGISAAGIAFQWHDSNKIAGDLTVDASHLQWPLRIRKWQNGDNFQPLGMSGRQKLSDHLTNRKVSSHLKEKALVLCGADGTIYAIIYPEPAANNEKGAIAELAKCDDSTTNTLTININ